MASSSSKRSSPASAASTYIFHLVWLSAVSYLLFGALYNGYKIRLGAIEEYGPVIHEFDPYFNYRATEYLYEHGAKKFFSWFDYLVWYPLGRPVGTTIYPGMQFTAVYIKQYLLGDKMSLNDICCYMPAWFGVIASFIVGLIAYECSLPQNTGLNILTILVDIAKGKKSDEDGNVIMGFGDKRLLGLSSPAVECGLAATAFMAVVPAHLMRSVGGGYDNESIAVTALCLTFYLWIRSLRAGDASSHLYGILAGLAYFYMVAAWGGYVFVLNMVGVHAAVLVLMGRFDRKIYLSYTFFYSVGTFLATKVPVVGMAPLKSLEQLGPCVVFLGYQVLYVCEILRKKHKLSRVDAWKLRINASIIAGIIGLAVILFVAPTGYFGPISSRVRGLFVKHTKTGNPLVDSVAEHQPASGKAYYTYLHLLCSAAPVGMIFVMKHFGDGPSFLLVYGTAAYFFSHKMVRLILLTGPIASVLGGIALGRISVWCLRQLGFGAEEPEVEKKEDPAIPNEGKAVAKGTKKKKSKKAPIPSAQSSSSSSSLSGIFVAFDKAYKSKEGLVIRRTVALLIGVFFFVSLVSFKNYCWRMSQGLNNPSIILKGQKQNGEVVVVDDYREAYWWLRDNTPEDSRIMAWWDYGYQITAIANRTTIADGNTWNHEHIALLGKALTTSEEEGYQIARHLADYVLVWGGGGGDDLAKSPHLARIANSVYRDHCPGDPTCRAFGMMDRQGTPSPMMERSFLYKLHSSMLRPGVKADPTKFQEVYRSKYGKVRIYKILGVSQESKEWVKRPENLLCDVPGSWFCPGQYPPALQGILSKKKDFAQLEDFNRGVSDEDYQKQYFENLANPNKAAQQAKRAEYQQQPKQQVDSSTSELRKPSQEEINAVYNNWADTDESTIMWRIISSGSSDELVSWLKSNPAIAFVRSADGRGPMWWAFEHRNQEMVKLLMQVGVPHTDKDKYGKTPVDLIGSN
mmetsp:Transcript_18892/g.25991  ORF Transcript_18892/g.25991 Transcript_18892/m.25991 type:complete len:967 (-) Transcript_18892:158-3058(-)